MPNTISPMPTTRRRPGGRWWRTITRGDLLTFLFAATLCSASYCLAIWQNSRGAADSRVLRPSAAAGAPAWLCGSDARAAADEPPQLDFESHHTAESAGLSVSSASAAAATTTTTTTTGARRRAVSSGDAALAGNSASGAEAAAAAGARR